jgi:hypothetical protein
MSQASVEDEIIQEAGEEGSGPGSHIEPNVIINPGGESGRAPAGAESGSTPGQVQVGKQTSPARTAANEEKVQAGCDDNIRLVERIQDFSRRELGIKVPTPRMLKN